MTIGWGWKRSYMFSGALLETRPFTVMVYTVAQVPAIGESLLFVVRQYISGLGCASVKGQDGSHISLLFGP